MQAYYVPSDCSPPLPPLMRVILLAVSHVTMWERGRFMERMRLLFHFGEKVARWNYCYEVCGDFLI